MRTLRAIFRTLFRILGAFILWQILIRVARKKFHFPAPAFIGRFLDSDLRRRGQPPEMVIDRSGIEKGMRVLEVGCGSGSYTTFVARRVGPEGEVCALDIQPGMLRQIEGKLQKAENRDIQNIKLFQGSAYDLPFEDGIFDVVYMITVLEEIPDRMRTIQEIRRVLKPGGKFAVTEWVMDPDYTFQHNTIRLGKHAGFNVDAALGNFWHYTVRFVK